MLITPGVVLFDLQRILDWIYFPPHIPPFACGDTIGGFLPLRTVICAAFLTVALISISLSFSKGFKSFVQNASDEK